MCGIFPPPSMRTARVLAKTGRACYHQRVKIACAAIVFLLTLRGASMAQIISITPSADAFLSAANPDTNYGGAGALGVAAAGLPRGEFASLLRFDLAPARASFDALYGTGAWSIQAVTLTLTAASPNNALFNGNGAGPGGTNVNFAGLFALRWLQNDAWLEGTGTPSSTSAAGITFNGLPALLGGADEALGVFAFAGGTTGSAAYNLALTPSFTADAAAGQEVTFFAQPADSGVALLVSSRTGSILSRPTLTVTALPEPGTAALTLLGVLSWAHRRRRA
jgi:hypothetical protein